MAVIYIYICPVFGVTQRGYLQLRHKLNQEILFHRKILAIFRFIVYISK